MTNKGKPEQAILFYDFGANSTFHSNFGKVDFAKFYNSFNNEYENFQAHYFNTKYKGIDDESYYGFKTKVEHLNWNFHEGVGAEVETQDVAREIERMTLASRFYPLFHDFLEDENIDSFEEIDCIFAVRHFAYASLLETIVEDDYFSDGDGSRWLNIKLLCDPAKVSKYLFKYTDKVMDVRNFNFAM